MNNEKTIKIGGKDVTLLYCAATETGFEKMTGKSSVVFTPQIEYGDNGEIINMTPPEAETSDYIALGLAAIVAYCSRNKIDEPIDSDYLMYEATSNEVMTLITTVGLLRKEWYTIPEAVKNNEPESKTKKGKKRKNA